MKRLPRQKLTRGLFKSGIIKDPKGIELINKRLKDPRIDRKMNAFYSVNRGNRWIGRLRVWGQWLFRHRDEIFQILGIVVMFMDDGREVVMDADEARKLKEERDEKKVEVKTETPDGEKVEDFTEENAEKAAEYYGIGINTPRETDNADPQTGTRNEETSETETSPTPETEIGDIIVPVEAPLPLHWFVEDEHDDDDVNPENHWDELDESEQAEILAEDEADDGKS